MLVLDEERTILRRRVASGKSTETERTPPDRHEALPDLGQLPGWLWRKLGRRHKVAAVVALLAAVAVAVALAPGIE